MRCIYCVNEPYPCGYGGCRWCKAMTAEDDLEDGLCPECRPRPGRRVVRTRG